MPHLPKTELRWLTIDTARGLGFDDLLVLNWEEVETDQARIPFAPNWPAYYSLERAGVLRFAGALLDDKLVGYSIWFVQPQLHHAGTSWAVNDLVYVEPEHRSRFGRALIHWCEAQLAEHGVKVVTYQTKPRRARGDLGYKRGRDSVGVLLSRLGYTLAEEVWQKIL